MDVAAALVWLEQTNQRAELRAALYATIIGAHDMIFVQTPSTS